MAPTHRLPSTRACRQRCVKVNGYLLNPTRKTGQKNISQQLPELKQSLLAAVKSTEGGVLDVSAFSLVKSLDMVFKHTSMDEQTPISPYFQGFFNQLNVTYPHVTYGSTTSLSQLCPYLTTNRNIQVKLLATTVAFGCEAQQPNRYTRRDLIEFLDTGLKGYIHQPGQFTVVDDCALEVHTRGFYLVPASMDPTDMKRWSSHMVESKLGLDDMGNSGIIVGRKEGYSISYADNDAIVMKAEGGLFTVLERLTGRDS